MGIAIITGASSGIGREFARRLDPEGLDKLWLIARRRELLESLGSELRTDSTILPLDLRSDEDLKMLEEKLTSEKPSVSYLINSAGFGLMGKFQNIPIKNQLDMIDVNTKALTRITHNVIPYMHKGSSIINISSVSGFAPLGSFNVYAATKAFVTSFSISLIPELEEHGIHSLAVCPGPVDTGFGDVARTFSKRKKKMFSKKTLPESIVKKALRDTSRKKAVSIYGTRINIIAAAAKFVSKRFIAAFSMRSIYKKQGHTDSTPSGTR